MFRGPGFRGCKELILGVSGFGFSGLRGLGLLFSRFKDFRGSRFLGCGLWGLGRVLGLGVIGFWV